MKQIIKFTLALLTALFVNSNVFAQNSGFTHLQMVAHPVEHAYLGSSVHLNGDWAFIAASDEQINDVRITGAVYVYKKQDSGWQHIQKLEPDSTYAQHKMGISVASYDNWLAVASRGNTNTDNGVTGAIRMFKLEQNQWEYHSELMFHDAAIVDQPGRSMAMNSQYLAIGARNLIGSEHNGGGAAVFELNENEWTLAQELSPGFDDVVMSEYGESIALSAENELFVGAPRAAVADTMTGAVYSYSLNNNEWQLEEIITSPEPHFREFFGNGIAVHEGILLSGAMGSLNEDVPTGKAYLYERTGSEWVHTQTLKPDFSQQNMKFGEQVSLHSGVAAISASRLHRNEHLQAGGVYLYRINGTQVDEEALIWSDNTQAYGYFGSSAALSQDNLLVGAHLMDSDLTNSGKALFYDTGNIFTSLQEGVDEIPDKLALDQNYPNPFNPVTTITYRLPQSNDVHIDVFDMLGRRVAILVNERMEAGVHEISFNASHLASGVYIYRMRAGEQVFTKKLTLIK